MSPALSLVLGLQDWLNLLLHFLMYSLLMVGGALSAAPDMHRYLVDQQHWLSDSQFTASIAIAQSAPGPNVLYVALIGWNVGSNAGGALTGLLGMLVALFGILLPSSVLTYVTSRWVHAHRDLRTVRAFKQGMAPLVLGLLLAAGWVMATSNNIGSHTSLLWAVTAAATVLVWRTRIHLLLLLGAGALLGWLGLV